MPWPQDAYVGQKVVCIQGGIVEMQNLNAPSGCLPVTNEIYTITKIETLFTLVFFGVTELEGGKTAWNASRFRPVQSTSTGFAILAKLQDPSTHRDLEDVSPNSPVPETVG